ncbi:oxygenase MpaB family protein [Nocardioides marmoribigeumensis]|uniref:Uncharacterized protein (DUF2236 family) n=1 Tax=Nocardioides marmoribigeumensis TaxID=433649 RepID=A0ABU2BX57_9ACTN|nr:oxygenase MpaB family protein [Nocardioides marmoribigeumensis]MDR7362987.1 uncharacterized protein (DUF2236 family) [Nocardioides marmoribigeumensis]
MSPVAVVRRRLGEALFHRVAGDEGPRRRERIHSTPGPRWFPHDSAIQRVHGDASMFIGGMRAVMLQSLHPLAMQAVAENSGYRGDLWGRLARTSAFLATTTFATADDAEEAVALVRRIHGHVRGTMPDGTPYSADDPHLLRWVHVAEIDSFLLAHQRYGARPLDQAGRDAYVDQAALVAEKLGADRVPHTEAELRATLDDFRPELHATAEARGAIRWLVRHPDLPRAAMPGYRLIVAAATELLPRWASDELGLPRHPLLERRVVPAVGAGLTRTIRWAMAPPPDLLEAARANSQRS